MIAPAVKNMLSDTINNGVDMLLFGQTKGSRTRRSGNSSYVSYHDRYRSSNRRTLSNRSRARHDFSDIIIDNRGDAEMVLSILVENLDRYEVVSVGDLYELVDITPTTTDYDYGWYDLRRAEVRRVRDGYILVLPRPSLLD